MKRKTIAQQLGGMTLGSFPINDQVFMSRIFELMTDVHDDFLKGVKDLQYYNRAGWIFNGIVTALAPDKNDVIKNFNAQTFANLLKRSNIKQVAEVGAGSENESILFPLVDLFRNGGASMIMIGGYSQHSKSEFTKKGITTVSEYAGQLAQQNLKLGLDLIVARDVFSIGGTGFANMEIDEKINDVNHAVIDLIHQLSDNPNAAIFLIEGWDILLLDRTIISKYADVMCWYPMHTTNGYLFRSPDYVEIYKPEIRSVLKNSANFVVLRKKQKKF